jgi:hypothetical protein
VPLYMIERTFAEQLELTEEDVELIDELNADEGVRWLFSFLSADRRRTYCLYEAPSPETIRAAARRAHVPVDAITEVHAAVPALTDRLRDWAGPRTAPPQAPQRGVAAESRIADELDPPVHPRRPDGGGQPPQLDAAV